MTDGNFGCYLQCGAHWHIMHYWAIFSVCRCCQSAILPPPNYKLTNTDLNLSASATDP